MQDYPKVDFLQHNTPFLSSYVTCMIYAYFVGRFHVYLLKGKIMSPKFRKMLLWTALVLWGAFAFREYLPFKFLGLNTTSFM